MKPMSLDQSSEGENRMEQELLEFLDRINRNIEGGIIGPLETINCFQTESFIKLVEGTVIDKLHCVLQPALENVIRSVAKETIDAAFGRILNGNPANEFHFSEQRRMRLKFKYKLQSPPIWTGIPVKGENSTSIEVSLVDCLTGEIINSGPESSAKIEIVVMKGETDYDGELNSEGFSRDIVTERAGNKSLLGGDIYFNLKEGSGCAGEFYFAHNSNWMKNCKVRLGARIVNRDYYNKVREAITESFIIRDRRTKLYEKREIPSLSDEVWRLKNISRRGALCKRLKESNIKTVQELLTEHFINPQNLQEICGAAVCDKNLEEIVAHALKCELNDKYLYYSRCQPQKIGAIFNVVGQLLGAMYETLYVPINKLSDEQKIDAHESVVSAFKHWGEVILLDKNYPSFDPVISNDFYAPTSHGLEIFGPQNDGVHIMTDYHENAISCNSYQGIASSNASDRSMDTIDDFGTYFESPYAPPNFF